MVARTIENRKVTGKIKESSIQNLCAEKFLLRLLMAISRH